MSFDGSKKHTRQKPYFQHDQMGAQYWACRAMSRFNERRQMPIGHAGRLETPPMAGFRPGMSSSSVIGRKLGSLYNVPADPKREIETVLETLDGKLG